VRAFGAAPRVAEHFEKLIDANTRPKFCFFVASRWIGLRLDLLCCLVTLAAALFRFNTVPLLLCLILFKSVSIAFSRVKAGWTVRQLVLCFHMHYRLRSNSDAATFLIFSHVI
jgi:hypothetical protein